MGGTDCCSALAESAVLGVVGGGWLYAGIVDGVVGGWVRVCWTMGWIIGG